MAQVNLSILKITGDDNDYLITDETARSTATQAQSTAQTAKSTAQTAKSTATQALGVANSKLLSATLQSNYTSSTKTLTLSLLTSKQ